MNKHKRMEEDATRAAAVSFISRLRRECPT